jgi:hypothetical protein
MSYAVDLIVQPLPDDDNAAWATINALRQTYYSDKRDKAPALIALHSVLTARYPCLCSYAADDPQMEQCPWADGPMIGNFAHEMGMLALTFRRTADVLPFVIQEANALGITVADGQSGEIHRAGAPTRSGVRDALLGWRLRR